ncbi:transposase family protein [Streptacidiphilus sp. N1-3]|uniref:Transposase family protein n=1 Tax=Streptacidiphilus alkalitolerans TaxID=3342712 RepID=A0ABV6WZJ4_9ACTN
MLLPGVDVDLERLIVSPELLVIEAAARGKPPRCPDCATPGRHIHSTYWRTLAERPVTGRRLAIRLRVRRYFCDRTRCGRLTFVEQVGGLSECHRRSSPGLKR